MRNHYAQSVMVGNTAAMTPVVCARGISFLGALRTVRAHGEYNYRVHNPQPLRHPAAVL